VKFSQTEAEFISGERNFYDAIKKMTNTIKTFFITLDCKGAIVCHDNALKNIDSINVNCVDPTGAGDAFLAGIISQFIGSDDNTYDHDFLCKAARFANVVGALTVKKLGTFEAFPTLEEVNRYI
jgi:fructokinase